MNASSLIFKPTSGRVLLKKGKKSHHDSILERFFPSVAFLWAYSQEKNVTSKTVHVVFSHSKSDTFSSG